MPKALRITLIAIATVMVLGLGYLFIKSDSRSSSDTSADTSTISSQIEAPQATQAERVNQTTTNGSYKEYGADMVASTQGQRLLFFHAPWCPQCKKLDESIKAGAIPNDVTIFKVDYDSNQKLRQQYGVTIQTTVVLLDANGNVAKKYVAYNQPDLATVVKNLL